MRPIAALPLLLALAACAGPAKQSGFLTSYDGLAARPNSMRASIAERRDAPKLADVRKVAIAPTTITADAPWLNPAERTLLLREMDAQLCFELSERFEIARPGDKDAARVRAAVTGVKPTGRAASAASAAASFFIPGPVGFRAPGTLGALTAEAELLAPAGDQIAAITWNRAGTAIGTDDPSLSRVGDALQFVEPFADAAARTMTPQGHKSRPIAKLDPCVQFGSRFRVEGFATKFATGLYVPEMSGAKADQAPKP
jgi:hypothetical protein